MIEASGRDRPGLLESLARALSDGDLSIQSAHIDSYGERAVDAFYVVTAAGGKLRDEARAAVVRGRLIDVLDAAEAPAGAGGPFQGPRQRRAVRWGVARRGRALSPSSAFALKRPS